MTALSETQKPVDSTCGTINVLGVLTQQHGDLRKDMLLLTQLSDKYGSINGVSKALEDLQCRLNDITNDIETTCLDFLDHCQDVTVIIKGGKVAVSVNRQETDAEQYGEI